VVDVVSPDKRSQMMAGIRGKDTKPELLIRRELHRLGFRFQLHRSDLPGKPDMVFPRYRAAVFVHGCFWHGHDCNLFKWPKSREEFWKAKIHQNKRRDEKALQELVRKGWRVAGIWECSLKGANRRGLDFVVNRTVNWLTSGETHLEIRSRD
jgi:DNA mismatch endonuclease (patch repair protein)